MKVSVVITTYNRKELLKKAIESVLAQTHDDIELIVADDGSTDGTDELVSQYKDVVYVNKGKTVYYTINRNNGLLKASGDLVAFLDDDNWWHPEFVAEHHRVHQTNDIGITYSGRYMIIGDKEIPLPIIPFDGDTLTINGMVDIGDMMFKRKLIKDGFTEEMDNPSYCSDMKLVDRVLFDNPHVKMVPIQRRLHYYRNHADNMTNRKLEARKRGERVDEKDWNF